MPGGNNLAGTRKRKTEFFGQMVYYEQLDVAAAAHTRYLLMEDPSGIDDDNDPAQNNDSTIYASSDAAEVLAITGLYINPHSDIRRVLNQAMFKLTVEAGLNARITRVTGTLGKHDLNGLAGNFTAIGSEVQPTNFNNVDGAAYRVVRGIVDDITPTAVAMTERLALRIRVYGYRTAGVPAVPITLWNRRGYDDVFVEVDTLKDEI